MAVDKMLVAFDESEGSKKALKTASELAAANPNAHIDLVYVVPIPMLNSDQMASFQSILDLMISDGEDLLAAAANDMGDDVSARTDSLLLPGTTPASEILRLADQRDYDMIVIGNRGLSGLKEYTGSVSHKVLAGAKVPVLVVWGVFAERLLRAQYVERRLQKTLASIFVLASDRFFTLRAVPRRQQRLLPQR